ncbi:hypothetical protein OVA24_16410 [Luteolibacter sp. SL250]|uniref:hypothetical protein n=1 Tax=Luteolibacter sp. SL250 TaxID=2995170 RepID=UPI0022707E52|nr:hypothetical protein [Luteolibacter sp. SL250]WAC18814.1 hypothetical protein OVA24_16410 [Luteolibacter sp. SL250]
MSATDDAPQPPKMPRHRLFADRVLAGDCLVTAYLAAGYKGTSATARPHASKLRKRPEVAAYIDAVQARAADESTLTLLEIRRFLARIVRTPLTALDPEGGRDADLIKNIARTSSSTRLEKLDPLKAIEMDLKLSGQDPETSLLKQMARALETLPKHGPLPEDVL